MKFGNYFKQMMIEHWKEYYVDYKKYLDFVMCGDDSISSKPSPEPLWKICHKLDIQPCESVMIGDTISDIHAGINAKFGKVVGVLTGGYIEDDLNDADYVIDSIESLSGLLSKNNVQNIYLNNNENN